LIGGYTDDLLNTSYPSLVEAIPAGVRAPVLDAISALQLRVADYIAAVLRSEETAAKPDGTYTTKLDMDDYRSVDGMMVPFRMKRTEKGSVIKIKLTQVKNNLPIEDEMFVKPASAK